jgi:hypothetical protein
MPFLKIVLPGSQAVFVFIAYQEAGWEAEEYEPMQILFSRPRFNTIYNIYFLLCLQVHEPL